MTFNKGDRCFSSVGFEFEYVCLMPDGKHIVRPVLETSEGEEIFGDLRQVDAVYTAEECDGLKYAKRETLQTEIEELERKRASLRLTTSQEEALAQHETLANLADWLAGKMMYFVRVNGRCVEVKSTKTETTSLHIERSAGSPECKWYIDGARTTHRPLFQTEAEAQEVARRIIANEFAGNTYFFEALEPAIQSAQHLGVPIPESIMSSRAERRKHEKTAELLRARKEMREAQERVRQLENEIAPETAA